MNFEAGMALFIPIIAIVMGVSYAIVRRYWEHKERMAAIEKGLLPNLVEELEGEVGNGPRTARNKLQSGLITTAVGAALTVGLLTLGFGPWLLGGLIPLFVGLAQIFAFLVSPRPPQEASGEKE